MLIDVNGIGYRVEMPKIDLAKLPKVGQDVFVLTYMQVNDQGANLYGFLSEDEQAIFEHLVSVSGIGPKIALAALSTYEPSELINAIIGQDVAKITKISGVGKKGAQRIILELKDKFSSADISTGGTFASSQVYDGVCEALLAMGFTQTECDLALQGYDADLNEAEILQYALKRLSK